MHQCQTSPRMHQSQPFCKNESVAWVIIKLRSACLHSWLFSRLLREHVRSVVPMKACAKSSQSTYWLSSISDERKDKCRKNVELQNKQFMKSYTKKKPLNEYIKFDQWQTTRIWPKSWRQNVAHDTRAQFMDSFSFALKIGIESGKSPTRELISEAYRSHRTETWWNGTYFLLPIFLKRFPSLSA